VVLTDVLDDEGKATAAEIGPSATYLHHDVTDPAEWSAVVASIVNDHGRIDVLVNNAGIFKRGPLLDTTFDAYLKTIAVNQHGTFLGLLTVAPVMKEQRSGSIINVSSVAGLTGSAGFPAYGASKWAVRGLSRAAAQELGPHGIRVNSIHPGLIDTVMLDELAGGRSRDTLARRVPLRREGTVDDVARTVLFLASDDSSYVTGTEVVIDGGMMA
jgi:3alpha(or 20beta)-hydroxysteroid dehydrogenase